MSSHHSEYQSQREGTPEEIAALINTDPEDEESVPAANSHHGEGTTSNPRGINSDPEEEEESVAALPTMSNQGGSQVGGSQLPQKPVFRAVDGDAPTRAELVQHANEVRTYVGNQKFLLGYLGVTPANMPPDPVTIIPPALSRPITILRMVMDMDQRMAAFEAMIASTQLETARMETATARAASSAPPQQQSRNRLKTPMPTRYNGKKGDPAFTFIAACNNYKTMEPDSFQTQTVLVRWCLQQLEDKAGQWAIRQMMRMDEELDGQGRPPKELRKWKEFCEFFLTQFGDPGLIERAKQKWKTGMTQTGKAVDYFEEVEAVLIRLNYPRNAEIVLDQVKMGLKSHIRTQFIGRDWSSLNEMKAEIIPYDSAYWEINVRASGERTKTSSGSKAAPSAEKTRSPTPAIKTENAKTGTKGYLPQEEFDECKREGLCFVCKKEGKRVKGSARFHPNHLPQNTKNSSGKVAATEVTCETDSDSDSDKKSKN
jgi:hypothetical protein